MYALVIICNSYLFMNKQNVTFFVLFVIAKISLFYMVFYGMLAALVAICMWVFFQTLDPRIPKWQMEGSIIGTNPGLGFRPMPTDDNAESTLIWFEGSNKTNYVKWVDNLMGYLDSKKNIKKYPIN